MFSILSVLLCARWSNGNSIHISKCVKKMFTGVTGKRTTLATVMIAAFIWMLAILCAAPALIGSNVKVFNFTWYIYNFNNVANKPHQECAHSGLLWSDQNAMLNGLAKLGLGYRSGRFVANAICNMEIEMKSCLLYFPFLFLPFQHAYVNKNTSFKYCYPFPEEFGEDYPKAIVLAKFLVYYAIPLVIIGLFYIMIAIHLAYGAGVPGEMQGAMRQVNPFIHIIYTGCLCCENHYFRFEVFAINERAPSFLFLTFAACEKPSPIRKPVN